jgi:hypothetical protein
MEFRLDYLDYGCETWLLTLREERKLRVFENMVLRRIFGPRRDEITGKWRRLHNEELNDLYSSPSIVRVIKSRRMIRQCSTHTRTKGKYAAITPTTSMSTDTIEPLL